MDDMDTFSVPFLVREMLRYGRKSKIEVRLRTFGVSTSTLLFTGFTRTSTFNVQYFTATESSKTIGVDDIPIGVGVTNVPANISQGKIYAIIDLLINGTFARELTAGWVSARRSLSWPSGGGHDPAPNKGNFHSWTSSDPAAGAEPSIDVYAETLYRLIYANVTLVTDATVANRRVHLRVQAASNYNLNFFSSYDHPASTTRLYTFASVGACLDDQDDNDVIIPIPRDLYILPEGTIGTQTTNLQAGDNFSSMYFMFEEFPAWSS